MSALILMSAVLSTLILAIVLSGMLVLSIKDLVQDARKIQTLTKVA